MGNRGQTYTFCILDKYLACFGLHFGLHVNNNGGDKTVTNIHSGFVYLLFLQCYTGDEACKGPISVSLWCLQMQCSDHISVCRVMSSIG